MFRKGKIGWTIWNVVEALILIVGGALFCAYSRNSDFQATCILIVAILVIIDASLRLLLNVLSVFTVGSMSLVKTDYAAALTGTAELSLGVGLIWLQNNFSQAEIIFKFIGLFIGIFLIVLGSIMLLYAIIYIVKKAQSLGVSISYIVIAALSIALGILAIVYLTNGENVRMFFFIVMGIALIFSGALLLYLTFSFLGKAKKVEKHVENFINGTNEDKKEDEHKDAITAEVEETPASETKDEQ